MAELKGHHLVIIVFGALGALCALGGTTVALYFVWMNRMISSSMANAQVQLSQATAQAEIASLDVAIQMFEVDMGRYPERLDDLVTRPSTQEDAARWNGPYHYGGGIGSDPWGNPYVYRLAEEEGADPPYVLMSLGADGAEGGIGDDADILPGQ